ncbi:unnamed protein product [Nyctereutes procyonoides]|uniref:(raccoon dog) hypothetical protein n=1 Tax=Nyctereutes procyonoides TaxID=34880 RepID=A0A811YCW5_NYCPR|nr:unnamed protein product [Nyctereutes procyonoides]
MESHDQQIMDSCNLETQTSHFAFPICNKNYNPGCERRHMEESLFPEEFSHVNVIMLETP